MTDDTTNARTVWTPQTGWTDDGPRVRLTTDDRGRLTTETPEPPTDYDRGHRAGQWAAENIPDALATRGNLPDSRDIVRQPVDWTRGYTAGAKTATAADLRARANEADTYAEELDTIADRDERAANAIGYGSDRAVSIRRQAAGSRRHAAELRARADALDPNDPDQGNCPDGHPCRLTPDATRRECVTCGYTGHPLTVDSADEPGCGCGPVIECAAHGYQHEPGCDRNHYPHDACNEPSTDPAECCGAEPGAPCRPWCVNAEPVR